MDLLRAVLLPQIIGKSFDNPEALAHHLSPWRGFTMARATIEMAFWDLWAKSLKLPLKTVLGGSKNEIEVGVSLGIAPLEVVMERVAQHVALGYKRIKLKIMPGHDVAIVAAVRKNIPGHSSDRRCQQRLYAGRYGHHDGARRFCTRLHRAAFGMG